MMIISRCLSCKHFIKFTQKELFCKAYPYGIPTKVWSFNFIHDRVLEGQIGTYVYEEGRRS